jgi:ribonuclease J
MDERPLRLIPLGGLGEFGLNAMVLEWEDNLLLLDAGVMFPGHDTPGVDSIVPDFAYLAQRRAHLRGIVLTHGHEDHIGAVSFALAAAPAPVYGSPLTLGFLGCRLRERGVTADLRRLTPGEPVEVGPFRVHPIRVAHSVLDSLALAIETPAGVVVASGDFKIDALAPPEERTDLDALSAWGDRGVLALLSDSTNVEQRGRTGSEEDIRPAFRDIFARTPGKVLVSCFASAIPRLQRVAEMALEAGRSIAFVGRRLVENTDVARELGLLRVPSSSVIHPEQVAGYPGRGLALFVAGSQGEPFSALSMVSIDEHPLLAVGPGDTVVLSARAIPGNERAVSRVIGNLFRRGADVVHPGLAPVHVSGHGSQDDLVELIERVRPRYLVPVHGEYRMLAQHARLAAQAGLPADRVLVAEDGDVLSFGPGGARKEARVEAGRMLLDRSGTEELEELVVRDRRHMSAEGVVVVVVAVDKQTGTAQGAPEIVARGFLDSGERGAEILQDAGRLVVQSLESRPPEERYDPDVSRERVRQELRRLFRKRAQRRPLVIPVFMEV